MHEYRTHGRKPLKTNIEYSQRKDGSISVIISGKAAAVTEAKKQVLANLTQQGNQPKKRWSNFERLSRGDLPSLSCLMSLSYLFAYWLVRKIKN